MPLMNSERAIRGLKQNSLILDKELRGLSQEKAAQSKDGPDGWSVVEVVCHLCEYDEIHYQRMLLIMAQDTPTVAVYNQEELARRNDYAHQDLRATLKTFTERRQRMVDWLAARSEADWKRKGIHPTLGEFNLLELTEFIANHDVNHIEQIIHTLDRA